MASAGKDGSLRPRMSLTETRVKVIAHERTESTASSLRNTQELYGLASYDRSLPMSSMPATSADAGAQAVPESKLAQASQAHPSWRDVKKTTGDDLLTSRHLEHGSESGPGASSATSTVRGTMSTTWRSNDSRELLTGSLKSERRAQALASATAAQEQREAQRDRRSGPENGHAAPRTGASARPLPALPTVVIPLEPVKSSSGRQVRNYELHHGSNRFLLKGRIVSSKDNPVPFAISLSLAMVLPILFLVFSGPFLWQQLAGGGKASIFVFVYMCLIMWSSMVGCSVRPVPLLENY
jgi:hypothetical protein